MARLSGGEDLAGGADVERAALQGDEALFDHGGLGVDQAAEFGAVFQRAARNGGDVGLVAGRDPQQPAPRADGTGAVTILPWLIAVSLAMGCGGLALFLWSLRSGQLDDLDGAAQRILFREEDEPGDR